MDSPYAPPAAMADSSSGSPALLVKPATLTTLGVLDLVCAGIGALATLASLASFIALRFHPAMDYDPITNTGTIRSLPAWHEIILTIVTTIITVLALIAGLRLVKCRRGAIRSSNLYAIASICGKFVSLPLFIKFSRISITPVTGGPDRDTILTILILSGIAIGCIYPILCLVLLNRPRIKDWLATRGT